VIRSLPRHGLAYERESLPCHVQAPEEEALGVRAVYANLGSNISWPWTR
jgi:hypothetical protein